MKLLYRADIDGLRAVAVLSVVFFHAGLDTFSGGYVGVDIFFVISGYLITKIIVREIEAGTFSLRRFYERRIRRIFPALFVVLAFSLFAGALLFGAPEFQGLGESVLATALFLSNVLFWQETGYFDAPSELKPLLHTWSLAVEEQFYIFFPLLLVFIARRLKARYFISLLFLMLASFLGGLYTLPASPAAAFYLFPGRAWELLLGALLALDVLPVVHNERVRNFLAGSGMVAIILSVVLYDHHTIFPGFAAVPPTLGSALVIYSGMGGESFVGRVLGLRPVVFVGLISYSFYLWHWPLLVFAKYVAIRELTSWETFLVVAGTFVVSVLSWRSIETPFRSPEVLADRQRLFKYAGGVMTLAAACGLMTIFFAGFPQRFEASKADLNSEIDFYGDNERERGKWRRCEARARNIAAKGLCSLGAAGQEPNFLIWGDSHGRALAPGIAARAERAGVSGLIATMPGCPPLLDVHRPQRKRCLWFNRDVLRYVSEHPEVTTVILTARWALSAHGERYKREEGNSFSLVDLHADHRQEENRVVLQRGLERTLDTLRDLDRKVVLVAQIPEVGYEVGAAYAIAHRTGRDLNQIIAPSVDEYRLRNQSVRELFARLENRQGLTILYPQEKICGPLLCSVVLDGKPLYRDNNHLSIFGSHFVAPIFDAVLTH